MKFRYLKLRITPQPAFPERKQLIRPIIPVTLKYGGNSRRVEALIDSGADMCLFDKSIGEALGINIESGIRQVSSGIEAGEVETYYHDIKIEIGGWSYDARAGFLVPADPNRRLGYGILGHNPIFEKHKITFNLSKEEIEFRRK